MILNIAPRGKYRARPFARDRERHREVLRVTRSGAGTIPQSFPLEAICLSVFPLPRETQRMLDDDKHIYIGITVWNSVLKDIARHQSETFCQENSLKEYTDLICFRLALSWVAKALFSSSARLAYCSREEPLGNLIVSCCVQANAFGPVSFLV